MNKVVHLTSAHARYDTRIFLKMCSSLASHGYDVFMVVADGLGDEQKNGVRIVDVGKKTGGRFSRMTRTVKRVFEQAKVLDADAYHLHDPELIPVGLKLKRLGKKVIFDSHEDVAADILDKPYLNIIVRRAVSRIYKLYENSTCRQFDAIVAATPYIRDNFSTINANSVDINNYPVVGELVTVVGEWNMRQQQIAYIGGIGEIRGIREIVRALELTSNKVRLQLAGVFAESHIEKEVKAYTGWRWVDELGFLNREEVGSVLARCNVGLVTFYPLPNHTNAQPNKMFEYMSAGIPVIASNFPLWREIVEGNDCGLCVDPLNPKAIAEAIDFLFDHPDRARQMGMNGQRAVKNLYNWDVEENKLFKLYSQVLGEA